MIHQNHEAPVHLLETPWQYLRSLAYDMGCRAKLKNVVKDRSTLHHAHDLNLEIMGKATTHLNDSQKGMIRHHQTLARWEGDKLCNKLGLGNGSCPCGAPVASMEHMIYECPRHEGTRLKHPIIRQLKNLDLPTHFKLGFATDPPLGVQDLFAPLVFNGVAHSYVGLEQLGTAVGIKSDKVKIAQEEFGATTFIERVMEGVSSRPDFSRGILPNARQASNIMKGPFNAGSLELATACDELAPTKPNVYSDGSVINPSEGDLQLGGAGLWCAKGSTYTNPLTELENDYHTKIVGTGVSLAGELTGQLCSSTRAEIAAGIPSIQVPHAVHIAADNSTFVNFTNFLLQMPHTWKPKRPWGITTNGDPLAVLWANIVAKGSAAVLISKTKGHATALDMQKGLSNPVDAEGNDHADVAAGSTHKLRGNCIAAYVRVLQAKRNLFIFTLRKLYRATASISKADLELREVEHKQDIASGIIETKTLVPRKMPLTTWTQHRKLNIGFPPQPFLDGRSDEQGNNVWILWTFIRSLLITPCAHQQPGITSVELFALFELRGGNIDITAQQVKHTSLSRSGLRPLLGKFKNSIRKICEVTLTIGELQMWKLNLASTSRLNDIGLLGHHASVGFNIHLEDKESTKLLFAVLSLRTQVKLAVKDAIRLQNYKVKPVKLKLHARGIPPWRNLRLAEASSNVEITLTAEAMQHKLDRARLPALGPRTQTAQYKGFTLKCAACKLPKTIKNRALVTNNGWAALKCSHCHKTRVAKAWLCACGIPWYSCSVHAT